MNAPAPEVLLVDAGGANLGSVRYALERLGAQVRTGSDPVEILTAERVILPGVGAAGPAMRRLAALGLVEPLRRRPGPLLGICLGMQLLYDASEEGGVACLGLVPGRVERLAGGTGLRVPHMGWNRLHREVADPMLEGVEEGAWAYFVHGFAAPVGPATLASCTHGTRFSALVRAGNCWGAQFHPERSGAVGERILENFLRSEFE